jgi:hypothetical protein
MGRKRQALSCSGHRTDGQPCQAWAINGGEVCAVHGGRAPQVKAAAAVRVAERKAEAILAGIADFEPVTDPLTQLQRVAGRAVRFVEVLEPVVAELRRIRYTTQTEQIDGRVVLYERSLDRAGKILTDLARLNLDERMARIHEAQAALMTEVFLGALADLGVSPEVQQAGRRAIAERVRLAEAGKRQPPRLALAAPAREG